MTPDRSLTDADVKALATALEAGLADALEKRLEDRFYKNLGKGIWSLIWRALIALALVIAAYGVVKSGGLEHLSSGAGR